MEDKKRTDKHYTRLRELLEKLFQLDQPDLDFGFYKIMHAKAENVSKFLHDDLLGIINDAFGEIDEAKIEEARQEYEQAIKQAISYGAPDPHATEAVQKAKEVYDVAKNSITNGGEIYEHLYRFFERYYDNGDFMSRRYYTRETGGKAATYAIPYDGREVYLHWANRDQYYIKTSEYLKNFTFDIAKHFTKKEERLLYKVPESLKLHCRIVDAVEGEHNNNKTTDKSERFFLIFAEKPTLMENGELVLQFEYRPDSEKSGMTSKWQEKRLNEAEEAIFYSLTGMGEAQKYNDILRTKIGEGKNIRTLLRKYLNRYTKRNTSDYFIHKDLDSFLRRELDFYIKNEIMRLDDIESAEAPQVESYLEKIKVLRKIAGELISFLAQLEEFQKKLWSKKKFVTETQYCITLDRIPEEFYAEIAGNEAQRKEWLTLFAIDELQGYKEPLDEDFLRANPFLVLDTALFPDEFKDRLLACMQDLDKNLDGLLIHSENFQALGLMQEKYQEQVKCIYIDPPYNTKSSEILYKNSYKHSSWLSLIQDRLLTSYILVSQNGLIQVAIDEEEQRFLNILLDTVYGQNNFVSMIAVQHNPGGRSDAKHIAPSHEYNIIYSKNIASLQTNDLVQSQDDLKKKYPKKDGISHYREFPLRRGGSNSMRNARPNLFYPIYYNPKTKELSLSQIDNFEAIYPIDTEGNQRVWRWGKELAEKSFATEFIIKNNSSGFSIYVKDRLKEKIKPKSFWYGAKYAASSHGTLLLKSMFTLPMFDYPKSLNFVRDVLYIGTEKNSLILDYFAGSGTTGHAVVNLNREDGGKRKYIMVEMGNYFDTVLKPRMQKVVYSKDWKEGKPLSREGCSHAFKYIRLESYEDTLNNLCFHENHERNQALQHNPDLRRGYMMKYWLDFETKDSPSLLNIDLFHDPTNYTLKLKKTDSDEYKKKNIDLMETFNWLIGLYVENLDQWRTFTATFKREPDPELPKEQDTRLILDSPIKESENGKWSFRKVEGRVCRNPGDKNDTDRVLIIWRKLTDNLEKDNLMLDEWFNKYRLSTKDSEFDLIYVNGSNNLPNLRQDDEHWKVRLIEEAFHQQMWNIKE